MANASDPLLEMFTSDVDEKAVSELVGSLESRLSRQRPALPNSHPPPPQQQQQAQQHPQAQQPQQQQPLDRGGGRLAAAVPAGGGASKTAGPDLGEVEARPGTLGPPVKRAAAAAAAGVLLLQQQQQQQQQGGGTNCQRHGGVLASGLSVAAPSLSSAAVAAAALPSSLAVTAASSAASVASLSSSAATTSLPQASPSSLSSLPQSSRSAAASTCSPSSLASAPPSVASLASSSSSSCAASSSLSNHADAPSAPSLARTPVTQTVGSAGQPLNGGSVYGTPAGGGGGVVVGGGGGGGGVSVLSPARTASISSSGGNSNNGVAVSVVAVDPGRMNFNVATPNPVIITTSSGATTIPGSVASTTPPNAAAASTTSNPTVSPSPGPGTPPTITLQRPPVSHNGAPSIGSIINTSSIITSSGGGGGISNSTGHLPHVCGTPAAAGVVSGQPSVISAVASRPAITLISSHQQQQQHQQQQHQTATVSNLAPSGAGMVPLAGAHSGVVRVSVPPPQSPGPAMSPARPGLALQQRLMPPQIIAPRPQTIQLPPGFTLPPGTVMVRAGEQGQLFLIQQSVLAQAGGAAPHTGPVAPSPTVATVAHAPSPPAVSPATQPQQGVRLAALQIAPVTPPVGAPTLAAATPAPPAGPSLPASQPPLVFTAEVMENVKKCKNFLSTLIKLASSGQQSPETTRNVKELVQNLLDAKMEPEEFTSRLQKELKSSPQPYLVPFLKKSLPAVRYLAQNPQATIQVATQANATTVTPTTSTSAARPMGAQTNTAQTPLHTVLTTQHGAGVKQIVLQSQARGATHIKPGMPVKTQSPALARPPPPGMPGAAALQASASQKGKMKDPGGGTFKDDDDINDVASMAGVNINEESARIAATGSDTVGTQIRSCRDEAFLSAGPLQRRLLDIGRRYGVTEVPADVVGLVSHAAQERLKNLVERLSVIAQHRTETYRDSDDSEQMSDVRSQLRFFEQLERLEKQRKDEQEREILLRAAKSRSRQEDPEQARLKQKAKEMQQAELAQMRQREANLTALAAIGPRKKRKLDSPGPGTPGEAGGGGPGASSSGGSGAAGAGGASVATATGGSGGCPGTPARPAQRARFTRVNLRDLVFLLEQDRETRSSLVLYRAQLK